MSESSDTKPGAVEVTNTQPDGGRLMKFPRPVYKKAVVALAWFAVFAVGITLHFVDPVSFQFSPKCFFHSLTGYYCPGCGTARALFSLVHGDIAGAIGYNVLAVFSLPFLLYALVAETLRVFLRVKIKTVFIPAVWLWILFIAIVAFWILRNLPAWPFSLLAP